MSITAAILILGACGSASRTIVVEPSIERIVLQVVVGGVKDVLGRSDRQNREGTAGKILESIQRSDIAIKIDGRERAGVLAWAAAAYRVAGYCFSEERDGGIRFRGLAECGRCDNGTGSVEYSYRIRVRGLDVLRYTRIENGRLSLVTDVYGLIGPRGELHHAKITITATETVHGTTLAATTTGWTHIGDRCRLVAQVAGRQIGKELDSQLLARIQRGGIDLYRAGSIAEVMR